MHSASAKKQAPHVESRQNATNYATVVRVERKKNLLCLEVDVVGDPGRPKQAQLTVVSLPPGQVRPPRSGPGRSRELFFFLEESNSEEARLVPAADRLQRVQGDRRFRDAHARQLLRVVRDLCVDALFQGGGAAL